MFSDDSYNKTVQGDGAGTLVGNWAEERALRDATGEGRSIPQRHLPRSGLLQDFTKTLDATRNCDDSFTRVYGHKVDHQVSPASHAIGAPDEQAGKILREGPMERSMRETRFAHADNEVQGEEDEIEAQNHVRRFETTTGSVHCKPNELEAEKATMGRKSYKNEISHGPTPDRTLAMQNEALDIPSHAHYSNTEPITHPRAALADPRMRADIRATAVSGVTPFGKNSEFSKNTQDCCLGLSQDEGLETMYKGLQSSNPVRHIGGAAPRGPFGEVPSLASVKSKVHDRVAESWGAYGYVLLRQRLFDVADAEGFIHKNAVISIFREQLGLDPQEVPDAMLDVYLTQLATTKKHELRVGGLMASLRPILPQKEKRRVLEAFKQLSSGSSEVPLGEWLGQLEDQELRATVVAAFGAQDEEQVAGAALTEQVFVELFSDLAPLVGDLSALLPA